MSDALGTATEIRDAKNYAGHRLSPWLGHLMVSRQETARPLLTPGEIMQLPPTDELVLVSGLAPIRAKKARYYADRRLAARVLPLPERRRAEPVGRPGDDWTGLKPLAPPPAAAVPAAKKPEAANSDHPAAEDPDNAGIRREPDLPEHEAIAPETPTPSPVREFDDPDDNPDTEAVKARVLQGRFGSLARQVALDPDDGMAL